MILRSSGVRTELWSFLFMTPILNGLRCSIAKKSPLGVLGTRKSFGRLKMQQQQLSGQ